MDESIHYILDTQKYKLLETILHQYYKVAALYLMQLFVDSIFYDL